MLRGRSSAQIVRKLSSTAKVAASEAAAQKAENAAPTKGVTVEKLPSGVTVATVNKPWPTARISILFRAGARHEDRDTRGMTHLIRRSTGLSTAGFTGLTVHRALSQMGAGLECSSTREHIVYSLDISGDQVEDAFGILSDTATRPHFYHWELGDQAYKQMHRDTDYLMRRDHNSLLLDLAHEAAFKDTLGRSLFAPTHRIGDISYESMEKYMIDHYSPDRCTVVGMGLSHAEMMDLADTIIFPDPGQGKPNDTPAKFRGGEARVDLTSPVAQVAMVSEGAAASNEAGILAYGVLGHALGHGSPHVQWGGSNSPLGQAIAGACSQAAFASTINLSYSDAGAFGLYVTATGKEINAACNAARSVVVSVAKNGLKAEDLERGKNQMKSALLMSSESMANVVDDVGVQASLFGKHVSAEELVAKVDAVTGAQVNEAAKKLLTSKAAMAAVGDVEDVPRMSEFA